jgi:hypothetical protein
MQVKIEERNGEKKEKGIWRNCLKERNRERYEVLQLFLW